MLKKFRKVEFGVEIGVILQQSRVLLQDLQYTVQFAIKVLTATRTHAQCVLRMRSTLMNVRIVWICNNRDFAASGDDGC